jgi:uncharacterized protein YndB with AHSA1/START domain
MTRLAADQRSAEPRSSIELRRRLPAPREEVFRWWTDPELMARWMSPVGIAEAELDVRPGGRLRVVMRGEGMTIVHTGEYQEVDPPGRLVFTWISPYTGGQPSVVTVVLIDRGDETELVLTHSALPAEVADSHRGGWGSMIHRLSAQLGTRAT